jgi:hypothetical protein
MNRDRWQPSGYRVFDSAVKLCGLAVDDHFPIHFRMTHGLALKKSSLRLFQVLSQRESHTLLDLSFSSIIISWLSYIFSIMCLFNRVPARDVSSLVLIYLFDWVVGNLEADKSAPTCSSTLNWCEEPGTREG